MWNIYFIHILGLLFVSYCIDNSESKDEDLRKYISSCKKTGAVNAKMWGMSSCLISRSLVERKKDLSVLLEEIDADESFVFSNKSRFIGFLHVRSFNYPFK